MDTVGDCVRLRFSITQLGETVLLSGVWAAHFGVISKIHVQRLQRTNSCRQTSNVKYKRMQTVEERPELNQDTASPGQQTQHKRQIT
jgi:hypothetical protein